MKKLLWGSVAVAVLGFSANAFAGFGAIAYSPSTGRSGTSWSYSCESEAETAALQQCGGGDCQIQVWVQDACAAFAVAPDSTGWAWSGSLQAATNNAVGSCLNNGGQGCSVQAWLCT
jgi:hypothetical protein